MSNTKLRSPKFKSAQSCFFFFSFFLILLPPENIFSISKIFFQFRKAYNNNNLTNKQARKKKESEKNNWHTLFYFLLSQLTHLSLIFYLIQSRFVQKQDFRRTFLNLSPNQNEFGSD